MQNKKRTNTRVKGEIKCEMVGKERNVKWTSSRRGLCFVFHETLSWNYWFRRFSLRVERKPTTPWGTME